ncbi:MAG: tetratricopeptide repeat protein [Vibrio sp.]
MKKCLWIYLAALLIISSTVQAKAYLSPLLKEADKLVEINPRQALEITNQYMADRKLVSGQGQDYTLSRESEKTIRTPAASVEALQITAKAHYALGDDGMALLSIKQAERIAEEYHILQPFVSTKLLHAQLTWQSNHNPEFIEPYLYDIKDKVNQKGVNKAWQQETLYQIAMFEADMQSHLGHHDKAEDLFQDASRYLTSLDSTDTNIDYHLRLGEYYLNANQYDESLKELLTTYWMTIKESDSAELAKTNFLLAQLFYRRQVFDKAISHATEAADYYGNFPRSLPLIQTVKLMADTFFQQGKYNLALVNYLNVLDNESHQQDLRDVIQLRIDIAQTYLKIVDYNNAQTYLTQAEHLVGMTDFKQLKSQILLLKAALALPQNHPNDALAFTQNALEIAKASENKNLQMQAYKTLSNIYQQAGNYKQAFENQKLYHKLWQSQQDQFNAVNEEVFRQQKDIIEKSLHYSGLENNLMKTTEKYTQYQRSSIIAAVLAFVFFFFFIYRGYTNKKIKNELKSQTLDLYTHPRSGLQNLKLLNTKLPKSIAHTNAMFEQWHLGELIHEPLNDRLSLVMFDLPFLRNAYLKLGYQTGLELEKQFGEYMKPLIKKPARLYHFADGLFLYIEPKAEEHESLAEHLFEKVKNWIDQFESEVPVDHSFKMGLVEYPFLPRAYTAINDQELIDILFMAVYLARKINFIHPEDENQWVHIRAIENAPAASFAGQNIRQSCEQAFEHGLIKIHTSGGHDDTAREIIRQDDYFVRSKLTPLKSSS